jgi:hypothetical protein
MYITGDSTGPPLPAAEQEEGTRHVALAATAIAYRTTLLKYVKGNT